MLLLNLKPSTLSYVLSFSIFQAAACSRAKIRQTEPARILSFIQRIFVQFLILFLAVIYVFREINAVFREINVVSLDKLTFPININRGLRFVIVLVLENIYPDN